MAVCLLGLGANQGDPRRQLDQAVHRLDDHPAIRVQNTSGWRATSPIGGPTGQPEFLNGAVLIDTTLSPVALLQVTQALERSLGRRHEVRWGPRPLDIDILLWEELVCRTPTLQIPHRWMAVRRFVLEPAAEIAPNLRHPLLGWTIRQMLDHLMHAPPRFALTGAIGATRTRMLAQRTGATPLTDPLAVEGVCEARSTRPSDAEAIEFFDRRWRCLSKSVWREPQRPVISEFWMEEPQLVAWESPGGVVFRQFSTQVSTAAPPKLLISWLVGGVPPLAALIPISPDRYRRLLQDYVESRRARPIVWLDIVTTDAEQFLQEAAAAILAMQ